MQACSQLLAAAGLVAPRVALAADWNKAAFEGKTVQDAFKALGAGSPANSTDIVMKAPDIAENGAVVPIGVESRIPGTESIAVLVEKNPNPLAAAFDIPAGTELAVTTRVKMAETSDVYALVKAQRQVLRGQEGNQGDAGRMRGLRPRAPVRLQGFQENRHGRSDAHPRDRPRTAW